MNVIIHAPTSDLNRSLDFYTRLGYKVISERNPVLLTDGKIIIEINPDRFARAGVKIFKNSWKKEIESLADIATPNKIEGGSLINDFNGCWIYLIEGELGAEYRSSLTETPFAVTGNFAGLGMETGHIKKSLALWDRLGFAKNSGDIYSGYVGLQNEEGFTITLYKPLTCPHLFFNPSMTFFNGKKNLEVIKKIREAGIPITEEITYFNNEGIVDNIIIRDPGGYGFFIFSD